MKIFLMLQYILLLYCHPNATYTNNRYENLIFSIASQLRLTNNENFLKGAGVKYKQKNFCNKNFNRDANNVLFILFNSKLFYTLWALWFHHINTLLLSNEILLKVVTEIWGSKLPKVFSHFRCTGIKGFFPYKFLFISITRKQAKALLQRLMQYFVWRLAIKISNIYQQTTM